MNSSTKAFLGLTLLVLLIAGTPASAADCNPVKLAPCLSSIENSTPPTPACCTNLKAQESCLCGYMKNPVYKKYITGPGAQVVAKGCGIKWPSC